MATITKRVLSGSTHGVGQTVTATQGVTPIVVHSLATSATTTIDEVWMYANNDATAGYNVVLEWGISSSQLHMTFPLPAKSGPTLIVPGLILTGSACAIAAYVSENDASASEAASSGLISIFGWVNRIVQS